MQFHSHISLHMEPIKYDMQLIYSILGGRVSYQLNSRLKRNFESYKVDLTPDKWMVLMQLWEEDGQSQQALCNSTMKDRPSMSRLIDALERQGLVMRQTDSRHRGIKRIHLTAGGRAIEDKARFVGNKTLKEALRGLSQEELNICQEALRVVFKNSKR